MLKVDGKLPKGLALPAYSTYAFADGSVGARFAIGSDPRLTGIRVCHHRADPLFGSERYSTIVEFSERIAAQAVRDGRIEVTSSGAACPLEPVGQNAVPVEQSEVRQAVSDTVDSARFACTRADDLSVMVYGMPGVDGPTEHTGVKISMRRTAAPEMDTGQPSVKYALHYAQMADWGDGCKVFRP
jgi:hypothetical protein